MTHPISEVEIRTMERAMAAAPLDQGAVRQRYGHLIEQTRRELGAMFPPPSRLQPALKLGERIWFRFRELGLAGVESWRPGWPRLAPAAMRGLKEEPALKEEAWHAARYQGQDCLGRMLVTEDKGGLAKFYFSLEDLQGREIAPFYLTVTDPEGKVLREKTRLKGRSQPVSEVPMGDYLITLEDESGRRRAIMGVRAAHPEP